MKFGQDCLYLPDKHAAIPYVVTVLQVALGGQQVWLFHKALATKGLMVIVLSYWIRVANISITGFWCSRFDAEGYKISLFSQCLSKSQRFLQRLRIGNNMVSVKRSHDCPWVLPGNSCSYPGNCRLRITPHRLSKSK